MPLRLGEVEEILIVGPRDPTRIRPAAVWSQIGGTLRQGVG